MPPKSALKALTSLIELLRVSSSYTRPVLVLERVENLVPKLMISNDDPTGSDFKKRIRASFVVVILEPDMEPERSTKKIKKKFLSSLIIGKS